MLYSQLFSAQTTRLTCDRATNICAVDGSSRDVPRVDEIARAEMNHDSNRRDGPNWGIDLVTRDGRKHPIEQQRAIANAVVANYAAAVAATNAYLANRAQPALDVSFTYRASLGEKLQTVFYLLFGIATLIAGWALWTRRSYIFEHDCVNAIERRPFFQTKAVIAVDRIAAIYDRPFRDGRIVELAFEDGSKIGVLQAGARKAVEASRVAKELADYLAKPLKSVTASAP
jgi:hypothetical protein